MRGVEGVKCDMTKFIICSNSFHLVVVSYKSHFGRCLGVADITSVVILDMVGIT